MWKGNELDFVTECQSSQAHILYTKEFHKLQWHGVKLIVNVILFCQVSNIYGRSEFRHSGWKTFYTWLGSLLRSHGLYSTWPHWHIYKCHQHLTTLCNFNITHVQDLQAGQREVPPPPPKKKHTHTHTHKANSSSCDRRPDLCLTLKFLKFQHFRIFHEPSMFFRWNTTLLEFMVPIYSLCFWSSVWFLEQGYSESKTRVSLSLLLSRVTLSCITVFERQVSKVVQTCEDLAREHFLHPCTVLSHFLSDVLSARPENSV
jgi:hypothetical protein